MYNVQIIRDSITEAGHRLTTMEATFPRFILAEINTHRAFSRNSASSRAIPTAKLIDSVRKNPFIPAEFLSNKPGMQAGDAPIDQGAALEAWHDAMQAALKYAEQLAAIGTHKQWANRLLEPYMWHTAIISATEWQNFFSQRCSPMAQPEMRTIAELMQSAILNSTPQLLRAGCYHLPYVDATVSQDDPAHIVQPRLFQSVARCARISYNRHQEESSLEADTILYNRLKRDGHWSPFEHVAVAMGGMVAHTKSRNFTGFYQLRAAIDHAP